MSRFSLETFVDDCKKAHLDSSRAIAADVYDDVDEKIASGLIQYFNKFPHQDAVFLVLASEELYAVEEQCLPSLSEENFTFYCTREGEISPVLDVSVNTPDGPIKYKEFRNK